MLDDELRSLVSVRPSPALEAGVRARIAGRRITRHRPWSRVLLPLAAAVVLAVAAGLVLMRPAPSAGPDGAALLHARPLDAISAFPTVQSEPPPRTAPSDQRLARAATAPMAAPAPRAFRPQFDPAERAALQRLFAASLPPAALPEPAPDTLVIPELSIAPLAIAPLAEGDRP